MRRRYMPLVVIAAVYVALMSLDAVVSSETWNEWLSAHLRGHSHQFFTLSVLLAWHLWQKGDPSP